MSRRSFVMDHAVRMELLCARAAVERESLAQSIVQTGHALEPSALARRLLPGLTGTKAGKIMWLAFSLARRYPFISSSLLALFMGGTRGGRVSKLLSSGLVGWQLWSAWQKHKQDDKPQ